MALGDLYASLTDLKARLEVSRQDDDNRFTAALTAASRGIEKFCGRQFNTAAGATARMYKPVSHRLCLVDDFVSITSLKSDDSNVGTFGTTWASTDYELYPLNGISDGEAGWPYWRIEATQQQGRCFPCWPRATVEVTAVWGWSAVPAAVKEATLVAAEELTKLRDTPFGVGGYGDFGVIKARENPFVARMLAPYRRDPVLVA